jgi:TonB family protein
MNYYEQDDRKGKIGGIIAVILYFAVCAGLMFISCNITLPEPEAGILVDFGTSDTGLGDTDLANSELDARPVSPPPQNRPAESVMTTEDPDAPAIVEEPRPETRPATPVEQTAPAREVNRRALFPGRTEGSSATSQGSTEGTGNQGVQEGGPDGSASEGGVGSSGFSLSGRYLVGNLPRPAYDADVEGRVVIRITVDREGRVTSAVYEQAGSTTNHGELVSAARSAAQKARFTASEADIQTGTITYIFRLN